MTEANLSALTVSPCVTWCFTLSLTKASSSLTVLKFLYRCYLKSCGFPIKKSVAQLPVKQIWKSCTFYFQIIDVRRYLVNSKYWKWIHVQPVTWNCRPLLIFWWKYTWENILLVNQASLSNWFCFLSHLTECTLRTYLGFWLNHKIYFSLPSLYFLTRSFFLRKKSKISIWKTKRDIEIKLKTFFILTEGLSNKKRKCK